MDISTKINQRERIINYLHRHGSATNSELNNCLGMTDARKRISELRAKGYHIGDIWENGRDRYGMPTRYKRYFLREAQNDSVQN